MAALSAAVVLGRRRVWRVTVAGNSMLPGFLPGDRLLLLPPVLVRPGHVVAVRDPRQPERLLVKRVRACHGPLVDVRGDNAGASTDSRHFGRVARSAIAGRVAYRYAPPVRVTWWPQ